MYSPYDNVDPRPLFEMLNTIDRLADKCELDRSLAWNHTEQPFDGDWLEIEDLSGSVEGAEGVIHYYDEDGLEAETFVPGWGC